MDWKFISSRNVDLKTIFSRRSDQILVITLLIGFVNSLLGWFFSYGDGVAGNEWNSWGVIAGLVLLALMAWFALRTIFISSVKTPELPVSDAVIYMAGGAAMAFFLILYWVADTGWGVGPSLGMLVACAASVATIVAGYMKQAEPAPMKIPTRYPATPTPPEAPEPPASEG